MGMFSSLTGSMFGGSKGQSLIKKGYGILTGKAGYDKAADMVRFEPFNIRTGMGSGTFSGGTGTFSLSPEYQAIKDQVLGLGKGFFSQAGAFDPNAASADAYGLMQRIAQPQRTLNLSNLRDTLFSQGRLSAAGYTGANPELQAFYEAQNNADLQAQLQSIGLGQGLLDSMLQRGTSLTGTAAGLDEAGNNALKLGLYGGQGILEASKSAAGFTAKAGEAESNFWNKLLGAGSTAFGGIPGFGGK